MKNVCFYHLATIGNYQKITNDIFALLDKSKLYEKLDHIFINIAGNEKVSLPDKEKISIFQEIAELNEFEFSTINRIKKYADLDSDESNILYLQTLGCTAENNICINERRDYMLYFNIEKYQKALDSLKENDAISVDLVDYPVKHFSGNIWWSKSSHIKKLPYPVELPFIFSERHKCEFWICSNPNGKYETMHQTNINVHARHLNRYPREKYAND